jgi:hypothetical protein
VSGKLVLVVGAGASKEFSLPTGWELKERIRLLLSMGRDELGNPNGGSPKGHQAIREIIRSRGLRFNEFSESYYAAAKSICNNMAIAPSIDNFLDTHRENESIIDLGKYAIAHLILEGESNSLLYVDKSNNYNMLDLSAVAQTWLGRLFTRLVSGKDYSAFVESLERIKFVSFNYDRCIQQFLWYAVRIYFEKSAEEVQELVSRLDIEYVYGSIGKFEVQENGFSSFGDQSDLFSASKSIKTFTEGTAPELRSKIEGSVTGAKAIVFLGFGYLPLNLEALFGGGRFEVGGIFGTAKGLSSFTLDDVKGYLVQPEQSIHAAMTV